MGDVHTLRPVEVGDGYKFDPDKILDEAKGEGFDMLMVIGQYPSGEYYLAGSEGVAETVLMLERIKTLLVMGEPG